MPTKRRRKVAARISISAAAAQAWRVGDFHGLARALGMRRWEPHPWPLRLSPLGCEQGACPEHWNPDDYARAQELQRALLDVAGEPPERLNDGD